MKKVLCVSTVCVMVFAFASVGFAAPLTDYSLGKTAVDLDWMPESDIAANNNAGFHVGSDGKNGNISLGATIGIGGNMAISYKGFNPDSKTADNARYGADIQNAKLLYRPNGNENVAVFVGKQWVKVHEEMFGDKNYTNSKNVYQYGVILSDKVANKVTTYGEVAFGSGLRNYEIGVAYAVSPVVDANVFYNYSKYENLTAPGDPDLRISSKIDGYGIGVTYKF